MRKLSQVLSAIKRLAAGQERAPSLKSAGRLLKKDFVGMISPAEKAFYTESAARYLGMEGAIVDLGCWLGSTSIALAQGLRDQASKNEGKTEKVFGFDRFEWEAWMPGDIPYCHYEPGDSFLPEARRLVREHGGGAIELIKADLERYAWRGDPIKILLVDAMKSENVARQIARSFFPKLISGGLLIHQDFKHYYTSWIHLLQYRLRDYFQFHQSVPGGTVAFEVGAPPPLAAVARATEFALISDDEVDAAFRYSLDLLGPEEGANIAAAHVMHYVHGREKNKALSLVEIFRPLGILDKGEFPKTLECLHQLH